MESAVSQWDMTYEILLTSLCQGQQGSGDGNDAGQWGGGGFPSPIGGGSACPQGQEVDGCVNIFEDFT